MGIFDYYRRYRQHQADVAHSEAIKEAREKVVELFQLQEHDGELWLTFAGSLVCPCQMLKDAPVDAVKKMRELYVKRYE